MQKEKYEELHDKLEPLVDHIDKIINDRVLLEKAEDITLHNKLTNVISELLKNDNYKVLADHSKDEIDELDKKFSTAKHPYYSVWADYLPRLYNLLYDLEGEFIFSLGRRRKGKKEKKEKKEFNLNGRTLKILRYKNPNRDLALKLLNVHKLIIDGSYTIEVQVFDSFGKQIAEWDEYKKTDSVALVRVDSDEYEYEWRSANK